MSKDPSVRFAEIIDFIRGMDAWIPRDINTTLDTYTDVNGAYYLMVSLPGTAETIPLTVLTDEKWEEIQNTITRLWDRVLEKREVILSPPVAQDSEEEWVISHRHQFLILEAIFRDRGAFTEEEVLALDKHNYLSGEDTAAFLTRLKERAIV